MAVAQPLPWPFGPHVAGYKHKDQNKKPPPVPEGRKIPQIDKGEKQSPGGTGPIPSFLDLHDHPPPPPLAPSTDGGGAVTIFQTFMSRGNSITAQVAGLPSNSRTTLGSLGRFCAQKVPMIWL